MWQPKKAELQVKRRILKLLTDRLVLTTDTIMNVLKDASDATIADALTELRDEGVVGCTTKRWYIRDRNKSSEYKAG